jgi:type II secretory pathway pseudopilin PulG
LELLVVMVIISILFGVAVPAFQRMMEGMAPRQAAEEFAAALRTARQYAIANNVRTRVVFADAELEAASGNELRKGTSFAIYAFYTPFLPTGATEIQPLRGASTTRIEFAQMPTLSLPAGFVGQWIPCPGAPDWRTPRSTVEVLSDYATNNAEAFLRTNFYQPPKVWAAGDDVPDFFESTNKAAPFPINYFQTPYPTSYGLITTNLPPDENSVIALPGIDPPVYRNFREIWPTNLAYRFFDVYTDNKDGSLGTIEAGGQSGRRFYNLPGIEFTPLGQTSFTGAMATFTFRSKTQTNNAFEVVLDPNLGLSEIR